MDLLIPDSGLLFWMTLVFVLVFLILRRWGFPAIIKMVDERKAYIDSSLQQAHEARERLAGIEREGEAILRQAREQQAQIMRQATDTRDAIVAQAQQRAKAEGERLLAEAKAEIEAEKQNAMRDIRAQVAELSVLVAEKILRQQLSTPEKQMDMVSRLVDEVNAAQSKQ